MNNLKKTILQTLITGVLAVACCIGLLLVSSLTSQQNIQKNAEKSAAYFESAELFEKLGKGKQDATERDNYADCISTGIAYQLGNTEPIEGTDRSNPFIRILEARFTQDEEHFENVDDGLERAVYEGAEGNRTYSRYWHGGAAVIRLLLPFFDVEGMRIIFYALGIIINLVWVIFLVIRREYLLAVPYLLGVDAGKILFGYTCFEYMYVCLFVNIFSIVIYMIMNQNVKKKELRFAPEALFLTIGILTCFFDFLTAETATFTIPAFVSLYVMENALNKPYTIQKEGEDKKKTSPWMYLLRIGLFWLLGYAFMFLLKWGLCAVVLGPEEARLALSSIAERTVGEVHETLNTASETVGIFDRIMILFERNFACLYSIPNGTAKGAVRLILFAVPAFFYILWFFFRDKDSLHGKDKKTGKKEYSFFPVYLTLAAVPILRFLVLSNHSYLHYFFTYRALMILVMVLAYWFIKTTILKYFLKSR